MFSRAAAKRFWSKVRFDGPTAAHMESCCWLWTGAVTGRDRGGRARGNLRVDGRPWYAHRFAYALHHGGDVPPGQQIDHRCHVSLCVRPLHLRAVTHKQNLENRAGAQCNSKSGVRGVSWNKKLKRWSAEVGHHGRRFHVGFFTDLDDAAEAVKAKRLELFTHNDLDRIATDAA